MDYITKKLFSSSFCQGEDGGGKKKKGEHENEDEEDADSDDEGGKGAGDTVPIDEFLVKQNTKNTTKECLLILKHKTDISLEKEAFINQ